MLLWKVQRAQMKGRLHCTAPCSPSAFFPRIPLEKSLPDHAVTICFENLMTWLDPKSFHAKHRSCSQKFAHPVMVDYLPTSLNILGLERERIATKRSMLRHRGRRGYTRSCQWRISRWSAKTRYVIHACQRTWRLMFCTITSINTGVTRGVHLLLEIFQFCMCTEPPSTPKKFSGYATDP